MMLRATLLRWGTTSPADDIISFQSGFTGAGPWCSRTRLVSTALDDSKAKPEEGVVWIVAEFDEDEYAKRQLP